MHRLVDSWKTNSDHRARKINRPPRPHLIEEGPQDALYEDRFPVEEVDGGVCDLAMHCQHDLRLDSTGKGWSVVLLSKGLLLPRTEWAGDSTPG